jgi:hypothetical protein
MVPKLDISCQVDLKTLWRVSGAALATSSDDLDHGLDELRLELL